MDDIDFKAKVTRAEFEELCADLFERVPLPVQDALAAAEMSMVSSPSPFTSAQGQPEKSSGQFVYMPDLKIVQLDSHVELNVKSVR